MFIVSVTISRTDQQTSSRGQYGEHKRYTYFRRPLLPKSPVLYTSFVCWRVSRAILNAGICSAPCEGVASAESLHSPSFPSSETGIWRLLLSNPMYAIQLQIVAVTIALMTYRSSSELGLLVAQAILHRTSNGHSL